MGGLINPWLILAVLALAAGSAWQGYRIGHRAAEAAHGAEILKQIEEARQLEAERIQIARERDELARRLEDEANADPVVVNQCIGPGRVRRLNALD